MRIDQIDQIAKHCTGCLACVDICPQKCIVSVTDKNGFTFSQIDKDKCINCGKCAKVCPANNQNVNDTANTVFAAFCKDKATRNNGSSGGAFECIAKYCLNNGYYVCGAAFDEQLKLKHEIINDPTRLHKLLKSKYIQSDTEGVFEKIKNLLADNNRVLFCGTPCQVSSLKNFVTKEQEKSLITIDIICHGVPSQNMFDNYLKTIESNNSKVCNFKFRVKDNRFKHPHGYSYTIKTDSKNTKINGIYTQSSFYNAFKNYLIFRESCYSCKYATPQRAGDITLGDFWGIEKYDFDKNTKNGVSLILANTEKGKCLFDKISGQMVFKEFPVQYAIDSNHCLSKSTSKPSNYQKIFDNYLKYGYADTANKFFASNGIVQKIYWAIPPFLRNFLRKLRVR